MQKAQTQHICLPKVAFGYTEDRFVMKQSRLSHIKIGGGNRHPHKARKCQGIRQFSMRSISMFIFLFIAVVSFSQTVTITGTAFDSTNGRLPVHVVVNDSLRKFREALKPDWEQYKNLIADSNVTVFTAADGKFQIRARKTDSIFFQSYRHIQKVYAVTELLRMKEIDIRLDPEICIPDVSCTDTAPSNFYIFVGRKIKVEYEQEPYYCDYFPMDSRYKAEYIILEQKYGNYGQDTIRFAAYDHYGRPPFSKYENVLLFVSEYCGKLYHSKYQYFELYKTTDGKWASPGDPYKYDSYHKNAITARPIQFADDLWFDLSKLNKEIISQQYPAPYYRIEGQRAFPVMGTYVEDLITVKKEGVLKARKIKID